MSRPARVPVQVGSVTHTQALLLWQNRCASCTEPLALGEDGQPLAHFILDSVPVHYGCALKRIPERVWATLVRIEQREAESHG